MRKIWRLLPLAMLLLCLSCAKQSDTPVQSPETQPINTTEVSTAFAEVLAKAIQNKEVRDLIKQEALKKFDNDYDVLYQLSKTATLGNGKTLESLLAAYANDSAAFIAMADQLPLTTIFVPYLNKFSPQDWNTEEQVPIVAIRNPADKKQKKQLLAYDANGATTALSYEVQPDKPVIVVKENERVAVANNTGSERIAQHDNYFLRTAGKDFYFTDASYNGLSTATATATSSRLGFTVDPAAVYARVNNIDAIRDYVYYGLDPAHGVDKGPLKNNYAEFLMGLGVNSAASKTFFVDWSDGMLEFRMTVFFIANEGSISSITKNFPGDAAVLFPGGNATGFVDLTDHPIELANWDMAKYGDAWKILLIEYDPGAEITYNTSVSSTFGYNFGLDAGLGTIVKIGLKFGISGTTTKSSSTSIKITDGADNLGEAILDYASPAEVFAGYHPPRDPGPAVPTYIYYELNTGVITLYITPRKRF